MPNLPRHHIEARRTERSLLAVALFVIGAVMVVLALISDASFENPFSVIARRVEAAISKPVQGR